MLSSKPVRIFLIIILLGVGAWLVAAPADLGTETVARQQAAQALAPVPVSGDRGISADSGAAVSPVVVHMKDVPPGVYDPNNQYDRWQRGEIDLD